MLSALELLIVVANVLALVWALLPVKRVPRILDFVPSIAIVLLVAHLFLDTNLVKVRIIPIYIFTIVMFILTIGKIFRHNPQQPKPRRLAVVARVFGFIILAICVMIPTIVLPFHALPEPTGRYNVGTVTSDFTDINRVETLAKEVGVNRKIAVQFWYPTDKASEGVLHEISGAPIASEHQQYPVLIFSHGAFGMRRGNASTFRELASHGYIVASVDHTYHSFYTSFENGDTAPVNVDFLKSAMQIQTDSVTLKESFDISHEWLELRVSDIELLIDSLYTGEIGKSAKFLEDHMDLTKIGLFGHSLGGATAAQVSRQRDDIGAVIVLDGTLIGDIIGINDNKEVITEEPFNKPLMQMYGSLFLSNEGKESGYLPNIMAFNNASKDAYNLVLKESGHLNFTDLPRISPFLAGMLGVGTIDAYEGIKLVNAYSLAFFNQYLKGKPSILLDGNAEIEEIEFDKRSPETIHN